MAEIISNAKMENNKTLLEIVLDSIPIPIFYKNEQGLYLGCNSAYETFFGITRQQLAGKSVHDVFDRELSDKFKEMDMSLYRKPGTQVYESTVRNSSGLRRTVIFHKATFLNPQGVVAGLVGAVIDTTELKDTEKKLSEAKTSFNRVFDAIPDLLSVVDKDLKIVYSNWHGGFDYVAEEVRTTHPYCYDAYFPGQGKPCNECHLLEVFRTGTPFITEKYNPRIGYLEVHAFPVFDESGEVIMAAEYLRNITRRKETGNALCQANQLLEAIVNASPLAIIALDSDINLILWNDAAEDMFGWKREEVLFKPYPIIPEDRLAEVQENIRLLKKGEVCRFQETCRMHKDGSLVDVRLSTAAMLGPDGGIMGYMAIMSDITEHKRVQHEIREYEANYRAIFDAANDAIFVLDIDSGAILDVNSKLCEMYGYTREEVLLLKIEDLSSGEKPYVQDNALAKIRMARNNSSHLFEWIAKDSTGRFFWVEVNMKEAVIGSKLRALAVVRDITERKQSNEALRESEERFRQIFEQNEDAAFILSPGTFSIVDVNSAAVNLYGFTKKEFKGVSPALFMSETAFDKLAQTFSKLENKSPKTKVSRIDRLEIVGKNGKTLVTSVLGKIIKSHGKNYLYCTFRDITEKLRYREERIRLEEKLIQANKMTALGTLSSGIAHEINNPNNYILSSSQFLHEAWKDIEQVLREYGRENGEYSVGGLPVDEAIDVIPKLLASLEEGSARIKNIVENLKSFARQEKQPSYNSVIDLNMAVRASINLLGNQIHKYTDNFFIHLDERLPKVQGSFQQIEQVIVNLTINALQSLPDKNSGIYISTFLDKYTQDVVFQVRDQGTGIPRDLIQRIMEPFFTTKHDMGGTGLGLSICYSIIKKHQGTLECESDQKLGTIFTVRLPVYGAQL